MSIFGLPLIFQIPGDDMGDLEYIEGKVVANDYFQVSGDIDNLNDTIEFVVPFGRRAFLIEAKIAPNSLSNSNNRVSAALFLDSIKKDETSIFRFQNQQTNSGFGMAENNGKFNVLGLSLIGDGIKKIEIKNVLDIGGAFATMSGYLV